MYQTLGLAGPNLEHPKYELQYGLDYRNVVYDMPHGYKLESGINYTG